MEYQEFLEKVINDGIEAAEDSYFGDSPAKTMKRFGSIHGFEDCRGKLPEELAVLKKEAAERVTLAYREQADDYWYWRCRDAEVEWVCNVVSALLANERKKPLFPDQPTARAVAKAASVLSASQ